MRKLTKDQFNKLSESEQIDYINELGNFYCDCDLVEKVDVAVIDLDSDTEIENLFDYLLDLDTEGTDLQGRCFADDGAELIEEIITDNIRNIDDYDTVADFLESIKQALCDGEYLATLDTDESTVEQAYSMLDNGDYKLDKGIILNHFIDKSGLKVNFLIEKLGINRTTYYRKIENDFNFSRSELMTIKEVLHLTDEEFLKLF